MNKIAEKQSDAFSGNYIDTSIPVLILGGKENSLSLTRGLGKIGVKVSVSGPRDCWGSGSKFCSKSFPVPAEVQSKLYWEELLLGEYPVVTQPHVILPCCDDSVEFLAEHENELRRRHIFDNGSARQKLALLDKQQTLELASAAGVGTPNFWPVSNADDIDHILEVCKFPLIVKPLNTFKFAKIFGTKFFIVQSSPEQLRDKVRLANDSGFDVLIVELIPGPDDLLSSYYTYIDDDGESLFHFTKRIFRRYPLNRGGATYHATEWLPETAEEGAKFFRNTGFRGLGNIEFKRDPRDQKLKIIEVNARFTAAQELAVRSGVPIDLIVYCHLTGQPIPSVAPYELNMRFWYPARDFLSYLELRRLGQLSFFGWMKSLDFRRHVSPLFNLSDLKPALGAMRSIFQKIVLRLTERVFGAKNESSHSHTP